MFPNITMPDVEVIRRRVGAGTVNSTDVVFAPHVVLSDEQLEEIAALSTHPALVDLVLETRNDRLVMSIPGDYRKMPDERKEALRSWLQPKYLGVARPRAQVVREGEDNTGMQVGTVIWLRLEDESVLDLVDCAKIEAVEGVTSARITRHSRTTPTTAVRFGVKSKSRDKRVLRALTDTVLLAAKLLDAGEEFLVDDHWAYELFPEFGAENSSQNNGPAS